MAATGSVDLLARTLAQTEASIARVRPEQATLAGDAPLYDRLAGFFGRDPG
jgi:hypothetical protein